jgi:hypothetical protein
MLYVPLPKILDLMPTRIHGKHKLRSTSFTFLWSLLLHLFKVHKFPSVLCFQIPSTYALSSPAATDRVPHPYKANITRPEFSWTSKATWPVTKILKKKIQTYVGYKYKYKIPVLTSADKQRTPKLISSKWGTWITNIGPRTQSFNWLYFTVGAARSHRTLGMLWCCKEPEAVTGKELTSYSP